MHPCLPGKKMLTFHYFNLFILHIAWQDLAYLLSFKKNQACFHMMKNFVLRREKLVFLFILGGMRGCFPSSLQLEPTRHAYERGNHTVIWEEE